MQLSEAQVIKRGFYLPCPQCSAPDWYPLQSLHERLVCTGCSNEFMLPVEQPPGSEIRWQYRLNSLVNRAMDQDVLPNILALHHLTKDRPCACISIGMKLLREDKEKAEFDFLFVSEQQLYAGECKAGRELKEKDYIAAVLAAELGFAGFYFCTVQTFSSETEHRVEELRAQLRDEGYEMDIEILSGTELLGEPVLID